MAAEHLPSPAEVDTLNIAEAFKITQMSKRHNTKMPGLSYGLSAQNCHLGSKLRLVEGSTCSNCYALKGRYVGPVVIKAHEKRRAALIHPLWVTAMATILQTRPIFRWHDSGDLQGEWHLDLIVQVCQLTPKTKHWLPTREAAMVRRWLSAHAEGLPANLVIRLSATLIDQAPPVHWPTTSQVITSQEHKLTPKTVVCPATTIRHRCDSCRACWSPKVANIAYMKH